MKSESIKGFERYENILRDIEAARSCGRDYAIEKVSVEEFIKRLHPASMRLRVSEIIPETASARTFRLVSDDDCLPPFQAGQYVCVSVEIGNVRTSRPYSISSPPNQTGYYDLTVRRAENGFVSGYLLDHLRRGEILTCSGPTGNFYHNPLFHDRTMVCLAGGSGITPFMSMIQEIVDCGLDRRLILLFGNRTVEEAIFHRRLMDISGRFENIQYHPVIEAPPKGYAGYQGLITGKLVQEITGEPDRKTFYICGPRGMHDFCIPELKRIGIQEKKIRREACAAPKQVSALFNWPENVKPDNLFELTVNAIGTFPIRAGESLLSALEKNGIAARSQCRSGQCSFCRVKIISGKVFQPIGTPVRKSDSRFGYVHACVSYPLGDLRIRIF